MLKNIFLIGDIGGTHARLALIDYKSFVKVDLFETEQFFSLNEILDKFLDRKVTKACFSIAGPISDQKCHMTNLCWDIDAKELQYRYKIPEVHLLNDLEASTRGLSSLEAKDIFTLNAGYIRQGNKTVISIGTGLGIGTLHFDGKQYHPLATEGGHADFAAQNLRERKLWNYLHKKYDHVSIERVISGPGLKDLYYFIHKKLPCSLDDIDNDTKTLSWFSSMCGSIAGNAALSYLCLGGLYIAGGIAPKILRVLQESFMQTFTNKGRFKNFLYEVPVYVVLNEHLPMFGALNFLKKPKKILP